MNKPSEFVKGVRVAWFLNHGKVYMSLDGKALKDKSYFLLNNEDLWAGGLVEEREMLKCSMGPGKGKDVWDSWYLFNNL